MAGNLLSYKIIKKNYRTINILVKDLKNKKKKLTLINFSF